MERRSHGCCLHAGAHNHPRAAIGAALCSCASQLQSRFHLEAIAFGGVVELFRQDSERYPARPSRTPKGQLISSFSSPPPRMKTQIAHSPRPLCPSCLSDLSTAHPSRQYAPAPGICHVTSVNVGRTQTTLAIPRGCWLLVNAGTVYLALVFGAGFVLGTILAI